MAKLLLVRFVYVAAITTALLTINVRGQQNSTEPLTNASVVKLVKAGFKEKTIVAIIQSRPNRFKLDTEQLVQLKRQSVSENIILAMLSLSLPVMNSDDWGDDELFFNGTNKPADGDNKSPGGSTADIFGSSSGSKSQSRSRAANGGNENEGNIGGSATVRILRPPSEAGGAPAKLERTPTLTNDGVIRLVEAGFSEGTIIKRIEESPVEFDLSPAKLDELHKRRVTDPIIAAMTAAMSDETVKPGTPQPEREN
ncbi:MAG TPA: hypothetical protein VGQ39_26555 [Pyrinomonadaceae bacterium]|nr:hypothetical protein [Pyrinomonadaceae bacterium]